MRWILKPQPFWAGVDNFKNGVLQITLEISIFLCVLPGFTREVQSSCVHFGISSANTLSEIMIQCQIVHVFHIQFGIPYISTLQHKNLTRLGQLGANISPDRSSLTPQVLIGNFLKHNYPLLYELQHINLLCLYLPKEDGVSPDAEYITQIIFSIFLQ